MSAHPLKLKPRFSAARLAGAALVAACAAAPALAQQPYYDPVRDVIVNPAPRPQALPTGASASTTTRIVVPSSSQGSSAYYDPARDVMVTPVERGAVVPIERAPIERGGRPVAPVSSSGAVGVAPARQSSQQIAEGYYDPVRDVMVTPVASNQVRGAASDPQSATTELVVRNGRLVEGPSSLTVDHGSEVSLLVESDYADSLSVDGYDLSVPLVAGQPVLLRFTAERPGRFAYRLARSGRELGVLEVGPPRPTGRAG